VKRRAKKVQQKKPKPTERKAGTGELSWEEEILKLSDEELIKLGRKNIGF
jgi:hypothetical protein